MEIKKCSFFGHNELDCSEELKKELTFKIEKLINNGYYIFYFGGLGDFDNLCWKIVTELKNKYNEIKRVFCLLDEKWLRTKNRPKWLKNEDYEEFVYFDIEFKWWYKRIYFRNTEIIKNSDYIIFYVKNTENSGSYKALQYASISKKKYINIAK